MKVTSTREVQKPPTLY